MLPELRGDDVNNDRAEHVNADTARGDVHRR
jgi:hypothetical protein